VWSAMVGQLAETAGEATNRPYRLSLEQGRPQVLIASNKRITMQFASLNASLDASYSI